MAKAQEQSPDYEEAQAPLTESLTAETAVKDAPQVKDPPQPSPAEAPAEVPQDAGKAEALEAPVEDAQDAGKMEALEATKAPAEESVLAAKKDDMQMSPHSPEPGEPQSPDHDLEARDAKPPDAAAALSPKFDENDLFEGLDMDGMDGDAKEPPEGKAKFDGDLDFPETEDVLADNKWPMSTDVVSVQKTEKVVDQPARQEEPCPLLWLGTHLDKKCLLRPNRWVKAGRNKDSHIFLNNTGVSRNHCRFRFDPHRRVVELRDTSQTGTHLNGEFIQNARREKVQHGDLIRIVGKGVQYNMLLDLRPVQQHLSLEDPKQVMRQRRQAGKPGGGTDLNRTREKVRQQLEYMDRKVERLEKLNLEKEMQFYDLSTKRRERLAKDKEQEEQLKGYLESLEARKAELQQSREEWMDRLREEYIRTEDAETIIVNRAKELQERVEKLQMKKDEFEQALHPEAYNLQDTSRAAIEGQLMRPPSAGFSGTAPETRSHSNRSAPEDAEEEAFFKGESLKKELAEGVLTAEQEEKLIDNLFGDFTASETEEQETAATLKPEEPSEPSAKKRKLESE